VRAFVLLLAAFAVAFAVAGCDPFAPHESTSRSVEGCSEAVTHLRACCPAWDSYISCTYFDDLRPTPDVTEHQSRCLAKKPCAELVGAVEGGRRICDFKPTTRHCRP
jgi:hypothetical protein